MNKDKRNNIKLLGTLNNADESGIIANANQIYDANENKSTQDVSKEHTERIKTLEAKENSMQTTLENITKTGEASAASNITYNHSDSKLDATNAQQAIDEVRKRSNYNDGDSIIDFNTIHLITDNPEFVCVAIDTNDRILYGIKTDGQPYFGVGCPQQVKDYINEQINNILGTNDITATIDSLKEIETFLKDFTNSNTLKALLDTKANKTDVDATIVNINAYIANKYEQINADVADKYKKSNPNDEDGNVVDTNSIVSVEDNPEYIKAFTDSVGKLIEAIGFDGVRKFFAGINVQGILQCVTDNPEFVSADTDNDGRLLESTDVEGKKTFYGDVIINGNVTSKAIDSKINNATKKAVENKIDKDDDKDLIDKSIVNSLSVKDNPEYIAVNLDVNNKVIDSTDVDGVITHNTKHIFKNGIEDTTGNLKKEALQYAIDNSSDLAKALKDGSYSIIATDWSDYISNDGDNPLYLPEPRCAILNIISDVDLTKLSKVGLVPKSEEGKRYNVPVEVQYWDKLGNYFKKKAYISGQGRSSMGLLKKNIAIDFFDSNYNEAAFATRIGNWVAQDSYHLKAYYTDFLKGVAVVAYKFGDLINRTNKPIKDRPWKKALINPDNVQTIYSKNSAIDDMSLQIDTNALCHPDGFPVIVYQNGSFYGIFAWQLKKHRNNYHLNKKKDTNIHLDGTIRKSNFFSGTIDWTQFEIRNPKNLYYKEPHEGTYEYNADIAQAEIAGDDEVNAWIEVGQLPDGTKISSKIKGYLKNTAKVKNHIVALSNHQSDIDSASTDEEKKAIIEKYFDVDTFIDYLITNCILYDGDAYDNNWQWITYDGVKWYVCEYDKDQSFGNRYHGMSVCPPAGVYLPTSVAIIGNIATLYKNKLVSRGKELIDANVINSTTLINLLKDWIIRIGYNNYDKEYNKWTEAPCNRDDKVDNNYWERNTNYLIKCAQYSSNLTYDLNKIVSDSDALYKSLKTNNSAPLTDTASWEKVSYDPTITYNTGDTCYVMLKNTYLAESFKAVATTSSNPISGYYDNAPYSLGYRDNVWRFINFINYQVNAFIEYINSNYKNN